MLVEVFKTNVTDAEAARMLLRQIQMRFAFLQANFDLHDCDNILRIASKEQIDPSALINLLEFYGFSAEPLPD